MIIWEETIDVITKTFEVKQKEISKCLHISESTLSRIKNGKGKASFDYNRVFHDVFDPNNEKSPAHEMMETEEELLIRLKKIIENCFKNVQKVLSDYNCWEITDYETFVLKWLRLTGKALTAEDYDNKERLECLTEAPNEQMVRIFEQSIAEYNIISYIYNLPKYLSNGFPLWNQCSDMGDFIKTIQDKVLEKFFMWQKEDVFIKIREFNRTLKSYKESCYFLHADVLNDHCIIWTPDINVADDDIIAVIDSERAKINCKRVEIEKYSNQNVSEEKAKIDEELSQLDITHDIVTYRKQLCELFEEICPGKQLLVF